jgi:hypothetical protein
MFVSCNKGANVSATFPIYSAHTAVLSMDCLTGIVSIYAKDDENAFLTHPQVFSIMHASPA